MFAIFLSALLAFVSGGVTPPSVSSLVSYYQEVYDNAYGANLSTLTTTVNSGDGTQYYTLMYALDGTIQLYEATQNINYLTRALGWANTMVSLATITDNQGYLNWTGDDSSHLYAPVNISNALDDFQGSVEIAELAHYILSTPSLNATYGSQATALYNFEKTNIVDKHLCARGENYTFAPGVFMSDKIALLIRIVNALTLVDPTINCSGTTYLSILNGWASAFHARMAPWQAGSIWDEGLGWYNRHYSSTDTSHGNRYPYAALDLFLAGNQFTRDDINGLGMLLYRSIWNQSTSSPEFNNFSDGRNGTFNNCDISTTCSTVVPYADGLIYFGWDALGQVLPVAQTVCDVTIRALDANVNNQSLSHYAAPWAQMDLGGHCAKNVALPL